MKIRKTYAYLSIILFFSSLFFGFSNLKDTNAKLNDNPTDLSINKLGDPSTSFGTKGIGLYSMTYMSGSIFGVSGTPTSTIYEFDAVTGESLHNHSIDFPTFGITNDGSNLYSSIYTVTTPNGTIVKMDETGTEISRIQVSLFSGILHDLAWDGAYLWAVQSLPYCLLRIDPISGAVLKNITLAVLPHGITWHNNLIWTVAYQSGYDWVIAYDPITGARAEGYASPYHFDSAIACNGTHFFESEYLTTFEVAITGIPSNPGDVFVEIDLSITGVLDIAYNNYQYFISENYSTTIANYDGANRYTGVIATPVQPAGLTVMNDYLIVSTEDAPYNIYTYELDGTLVQNQSGIDVMLRSLAFDGTYLWGMGLDNYLYKLDPFDMSVVDQYLLPGMRGITYDYNNEVLWAYERDNYLIRAFDPVVGELRSEFINVTGIGVGWGYGLTYTGDHIVLTKYTSGDYYYYKIIPPVIDKDSTVPVIEDIIQNPTAPTDSDTITITCTSLDDSGIDSVTLYYRINGSSWSSEGMSAVSSVKWSATIGTFTAGSNIEYYIEAIDDSLNSNSYSADNDGSYYSFTVSASITPTPTPTDTPAPGYFIPGIPGYVEDIIAVGIGIVLATIVSVIIMVVRRKKAA